MEEFERRGCNLSTYTTEQVEASILLTTKKLIGYDPDYTPFDIDMMMHINSFIGNLYQLGLNSAKSCVVTGPETGWGRLISPTDARLMFVKTYIYAKTKMIFDPPTSTAQMQALKDAAAEAEFRIGVAVDKPYDDLIPESPGAVGDHALLKNRDKPDQHPIKAITALSDTLDEIDRDLDVKLDPTDAMTIADINSIINKSRLKK